MVVHAPSPRLVTVDAVELYLRVWAGKEGAGEVPPGTNHGPYVERLQRGTGGSPGDPWCADEVADAGKAAFGKLWPVPLTGSCQQLADFGRMKKVLFATPERGDIWLRWHGTRFSHTGVVWTVSPDQQHIDVQAGNTVLPGKAGDIREGWVNARSTQPIGAQDRFLRWVLLLQTAGT
jgi:hypothetical protein